MPGNDTGNANTTFDIFVTRVFDAEADFTSEQVWRF